jgi:hypothetical protein
MRTLRTWEGVPDGEEEDMVAGAEGAAGGRREVYLCHRVSGSFQSTLLALLGLTTPSPSWAALRF